MIRKFYATYCVCHSSYPVSNKIKNKKSFKKMKRIKYRELGIKWLLMGRHCCLWQPLKHLKKSQQTQMIPIPCRGIKHYPYPKKKFYFTFFIDYFSWFLQICREISLVTLISHPKILNTPHPPWFLTIRM